MTLNKIQFLKNWVLSDCTVRRKDIYHFVLRHAIESRKADFLEEKAVTKRLYTVHAPNFPNKFEDYTDNATEFTNWGSILVGSTYEDNNKHGVVMISSMGDVYARDTVGNKGDEDNIPDYPNGPLRSIVEKVKTIQGRLYIVGSENTVGYRRGVNDWVSLCANLPASKDSLDYKHNSISYELQDIDGFAHDDLYVVGGKGNLWHFDGTAWEKLSLPSNLLTNTICCAGDGYVYIGGQSGSIFRGRGHQWELLSRGDYTLPFRDMVWHAGKVWCVSDYSLNVIENGKLKPANIPLEQTSSIGHLSVGDGVMLMCGDFAASIHDGKKWHLIFDSFSIQDEKEIYGGEDEEDD